MPINSSFERDAVAAEKWLNAFRLMAELGLRPIEVGYLKVKKDLIGDLDGLYKQYQSIEPVSYTHLRAHET